MLTNRLIYFFNLACMMLCFSTQLQGEVKYFQLSHHSIADAIDASKIYINFEQIIVTPSGMYINYDNTLLSIDQIGHDEGGYYIGKVEFKRCDNGHPQVCLDCHGCGNKQCLYRCRCYGGPRQN